MTQIQDVVVPTKGTAKYLNVRVLPFDLEPTDGIYVYWALYDEQVSPEYGSSPGNNLLDGNLHMTQETYDAWGTDDTYVINWVITELGLTPA